MTLDTDQTAKGIVCYGSVYFAQEFWIDAFILSYLSMTIYLCKMYTPLSCGWVLRCVHPSVCPSIHPSICCTSGFQAGASVSFERISSFFLF